MKNLVKQLPWYMLAVLCCFIPLIIGCTSNNDQEKKSDNSSTQMDSLSVTSANYEIVKVEDQSRKAMGKRLLSTYTTSELESLPTNRKMLYRVVFSSGTQGKQIKPTIDEVINKLTSEDNDIDEITLLLYSDKSLSEGSYDIGTATWAPFGELGYVDSDIAQSNNRENYDITYDIKDDLDAYLNQRSKSEDKFGLTEEKRRQFFKDIVAAEDKASSEVKKLKITDPIKYYDKEDELMAKYKANVRKQYKISEEQASEISKEAFEEEWPLK